VADVQIPSISMTLAPMLFRASPVEHLRSVSAPHPRNDLDKYSSHIAFDSRGASPLPAPAISATEISRPSSTSTQASNHAAIVHHHQYSNQNIHTLAHSSTSLSLPGLSALASLASAPSSQLRYVANAVLAVQGVLMSRLSPPPDRVCQSIHVSN
jgi:GATA-binding protein, other eukaryote